MSIFTYISVVATQFVFGQTTPAASGFDDREIGRWIYASVFALLLVWLLFLPRERIGQAESVPPWWRNVRAWAVFVTAIQLLVYVFFSY